MKYLIAAILFSSMVHAEDILVRANLDSFSIQVADLSTPQYDAVTYWNGHEEMIKMTELQRDKCLGLESEEFDVCIYKLQLSRIAQ